MCFQLFETYVSTYLFLEAQIALIGKSQKAGTKIAGVVFVHDITDRKARFTKVQKDLYDKLCDSGAAKNVVLATTHWSSRTSAEESREEELSDKYWNRMLDLGSQMVRFENSRQSAWDIVDILANQDPIDASIFQQSQNSTGPAKKAGFFRSIFGMLFVSDVPVFSDKLNPLIF